MTPCPSLDLLAQQLRSWADAVQTGRRADAVSVAEQLSWGATLTASRPEVAHALAMTLDGEAETHAPDEMPRLFAAFARACVEAMPAERLPPARDGGDSERASGAAPDGPADRLAIPAMLTVRTDAGLDLKALLGALLRGIEAHGAVMLRPCGVVVTRKNVSDSVGLLAAGAGVAHETPAFVVAA